MLLGQQKHMYPMRPGQLLCMRYDTVFPTILLLQAMCESLHLMFSNYCCVIEVSVFVQGGYRDKNCTGVLGHKQKPRLFKSFQLLKVPMLNKKEKKKKNIHPLQS